MTGRWTDTSPFQGFFKTAGSQWRSEPLQFIDKAGESEIAIVGEGLLTMKNIHNNILWICILAWILVSGAAYGNRQCPGGQADIVCHSSLMLDSAAVPFYSEWVPFDSTNKGIVCQDPLCRPVGSLLTSRRTTQSPEAEVDRSMYLPQRFMDENHASNLFFARHEVKQPVPIYTIFQTFLC